jgi:hypothetical protein
LPGETPAATDFCLSRFSLLGIVRVAKGIPARGQAWLYPKYAERFLLEEHLLKGDERSVGPRVASVPRAQRQYVNFNCGHRPKWA